MSKADKMAPVGYYTQKFVYFDGYVSIPQDIVRITDLGGGNVKAHYFRPGYDRWAALLWSCAPRRAYDKIHQHGSFTSTYQRHDTLEQAVAACGLTDALSAVG